MMSSHSSDCVEVSPDLEESSGLIDLGQLARELSLASSKHVMPSLDQGIFIPDDQLIDIFSYMANQPSIMGSGLLHRRRQPVDEESSTSDQDRANQ